MNVEVVAHKQDIEPGTNLGSNAETIYLEKLRRYRHQTAFPIGIADDNVATKAIAKGNPIELMKWMHKIMNYVNIGTIKIKY